jgi:hypothetical protein
LSGNQTHRCQEIGRGGGGGGQWLRQAVIYRRQWQRLHSVELGLGFAGATMRSSNIISNHRSASGWGLGGGAQRRCGVAGAVGGVGGTELQACNREEEEEVAGGGGGGTSGARLKKPAGVALSC